MKIDIIYSLKTFQYFVQKHLVYVIGIFLILFEFTTCISSKNIQATWYCYLHQLALLVCLVLISIPHLSRYHDIIRCFFYLFISVGLPITFVCSTEFIKKYRTTMFDEYILKSDEVLLPFLPHGQLSLLLDQNPYLNPTTVIGKLMNDCFECVYITFYVWGYLSFFLLVGYFLKEHILERKGNLLIKNEKMKRIQEIEYFLICWSVTFTLVVIINICLPAKSPRIYLKDQYTTEITGFGFAGWWRKSVSRDDSAGSFPSGHFGETFAVALGIYYSHKKCGKIILCMTFLIGLATLINRYHYFSDLLMGGICSCFGYFIANLYVKQYNFK